MAKRIYVVGGTRLVRAHTIASARNHVAKDTIPSELATQDTLVELTLQGIKVENAGDDVPAEQLEAALEEMPPCLPSCDQAAAMAAGEHPAEVCAAPEIVGIPEFTAADAVAQAHPDKSNQAQLEGHHRRRGKGGTDRSTHTTEVA